MGKRPLPALSPRVIVTVRDRRPFPSSVPKATQAGAPAVPPWNRVPRSSAPWSVVRRQWHQPPPQRDRYSRSSPYIWIPSRPGRRHPGEDSTLCHPDGRTALRQWHRPPRQRHRRSRSSPGVWIPGVRITSRPSCRHRYRTTTVAPAAASAPPTFSSGSRASGSRASGSRLAPVAVIVTPARTQMQRPTQRRSGPAATGGVARPQ